MKDFTHNKELFFIGDKPRVKQYYFFKTMTLNDYRRKQQQCPECGHPYLHERTITGRYEWSCPHCGLVVWEAQERK